jgi:hypothetical protein
MSRFDQIQYSGNVHQNRTVPRLELHLQTTCSVLTRESSERGYRKAKGAGGRNGRRGYY